VAREISPRTREADLTDRMKSELDRHFGLRQAVVDERCVEDVIGVLQQ
jgi:hypothetical protein